MWIPIVRSFHAQSFGMPHSLGARGSPIVRFRLLFVPPSVAHGSPIVRLYVHDRLLKIPPSFVHNSPMVSLKVIPIVRLLSPDSQLMLAHGLQIVWS